MQFTEIRVTGMMFYYYWVCKRKLWYFYHEITMEQNHENVRLGKLLDEDAYKREDKHISINDEINIDYIKEKRELHEVKKSKKMEEAGIWQVKYYLYYLKKHGVKNLIGKIDYPLLKQSLQVVLTPDDEVEIEKVLQEIYEILEKKQNTNEGKQKICKSCAYYDLCKI